MHGMHMKLEHFMHNKHVCFMRRTGISLRGTGVRIFHAWYRHIPCVVLVYSMRGASVFHVCTISSTGISMHAPYSVQAYSPHIISILIDLVKCCTCILYLL